MHKLKGHAYRYVEENVEKLNDLSQELWKNPELAFQEHNAHDMLTKILEENGFNVIRRYKLDTAFRAEFGDGKPHIAVLCEYDALPNIGHACGHNLISEVGIATGLAVKATLEASEKKLGKLSIIGCPGEEGKCGKSYLVDAGVFDDVDVAMMAHPSQFTLPKPLMVAMTPVTIRFTGKSAHAGSFPWDGINALDAAVSFYNNISCMRQQFKPTWRIMGVFRKAGDIPNIIPNETELEYFIYTPTDEELVAARGKVVQCIKGAAVSSGCEVTYKFADHFYSSLKSNSTMAKVFEDNAVSIGIHINKEPEIVNKYGGCTDMGNVSNVVPSIHPKFYIGTRICNHNEGFTTASGDAVAQPYTLAMAKALAMTAIDVMTKPDLLSDIKEEFNKRKAKEKTSNQV